MTTNIKQILVVSLAFFSIILLAIGIIYFIKDPTQKTISSKPTGTAVPINIAEVGVVGSVGFNNSDTCVPLSGNTYQCSPSQIGTRCENGSGTFNGQCIFWICPYGDTNNDCGCGVGDAGVSSEIISCELAKTKAVEVGNKCYQFDSLDGGNNWCIIDSTCKSVQDNFRTCVIQSSSPSPSPTLNACKRTFTVACATSSPSPSPSTSPSTPPSASLKCVAKKMYEDDTRNRSGFYYLEKGITDTNTLSNGQTIVYNIVSKNTGGSSVPDTTITDKLSESLTYIDGDSGCTYDSSTRIVTCTIGSLSPNSEAQRSFRARVSVSGTASVANTAEVSSTNGQRDTCSVRIDATGKVVTTSTPAPTSLPVAGVFEITAGTLGASLLLLILGGVGLLLL